METTQNPGQICPQLSTENLSARSANTNCWWWGPGENETLIPSSPTVLDLKEGRKKCYFEVKSASRFFWFLLIPHHQLHAGFSLQTKEREKKTSWSQIYFLSLSSSTDLKKSWIGGGEEENAKLRPNLSSHSVAVVEERLFGQKQNQLWDQQLVVATVSGSNQAYQWK